MGFCKPDLVQAEWAIRSSLMEIVSPYNDGWTSLACKKELYHLKCWLSFEYRRLPTFTGEEEWEKERLVEILKQ